MGFNYRQKRKEFEQNWAKALKQYIAAGMTQADHRYAGV